VPPVPKPKSKSKSKSKSGKWPRRNVIVAIVVAAAIAGALIVGSVVLGGGSTSSPGTTGATPVAVAGIAQHGTVLGNPAAKVQLSQYEDLQCPICKQYMDNAFGPIVTEYVKTGKVKVDFRGLAFIGPDSEKALRIALAAGKQNKLWDVVELFYKEQGTENTGWVTDAKIDEILAQVPGLDVAKVKADAQSAEISSQIAAVQAEASARQVSGTPTFFVAIRKAPPYALAPQSLTPDAFRPALDDALRS